MFDAMLKKANKNVYNLTYRAINTYTWFFQKGDTLVPECLYIRLL